VLKWSDIILCCVIADGPIQNTVLMSPYPLPSVSNSALNRSATTVRQTQFGDVSSNGQVSAMQSSSSKYPVPVGVATVSPSPRSENLAVMSPSTSVSISERPMLAPKLRDQPQSTEAHSIDCVNAAGKDSDDDDDDDDDDDVYNYPRKDYYCGAYRKADETYDTPSRLKQRASRSCDDIYDLPPKSYRNEAQRDEIYDVPPPGFTNIANNCQPPSGHGWGLHHSYINAASLTTVHTTERVSSDMKSVLRSTAEADASDYGIAVSSKTRSFKSSNSRYVLRFNLHDFENFYLSHKL